MFRPAGVAAGSGAPRLLALPVRGRGSAPLLVVVLLAGWWLRVVGLDDMRLAGDSAYSVYVAGKSLAEITLGRVSDGHPPLYYWVLHAGLPLFGASEYAVRLPTALVGALLPALAWVGGRRLGGGNGALLAAALAAFSPMLVFYSREPRMYGLLPVCALGATLLLDRALRRDAQRDWWGYAAVGLIGLWSHYYVTPLVIGHAVAVWRAGRLRRAAPALAALAVGFAPWLLFALRGQSRATAGVISNAEAPWGPLGFLETFWTPFHAGPGLDWRAGALLGGAAAVLWLLAVRTMQRDDRSLPPLARLVLVSSGVLLVLAAALFVVAPYAVRPRFMLVLLPGYLLLVAWALRGVLRGRALAVMLLALGALHAGTLYAQHRVGRLTQENESIALSDLLERWALPGDALAIQAAWQLGYLRAHYRGAQLTPLPLEELGDPPGRLLHQDRVWLSVYADGKHVNPFEVWLDDHWGRAATQEVGRGHAVLYARPPSIEADSDVVFVDAGGAEALRLVGLGAAPEQAQPGDTLAVGLRWRAPMAPARVTPFLHVVDARGERRFGADDEPRNGYAPTFQWRAGEEIEEGRALQVPDDMPPGDYWVTLGMYPTGGGARLVARGVVAPGLPAFGESLTLGALKIVPREHPPVAHEVDVALAPGVRLTGWSSEIDEYQPLPRGEVHWTSVDRWPLFGRRDWLRRGGETWVTLRVRLDPAPGTDVPVQLALVGPTEESRAVGRVVANAVPGDRLVRVHLRVPRDGPARLLMGDQELGSFRVDG